MCGCAGHCGEFNVPDGCWCDDLCINFGDCCAYCRTAEHLTVVTFEYEHIVPRSAGGQTELENLCISRGIPMPKLKIVEDSALNAFATGLNHAAAFFAASQILIGVMAVIQIMPEGLRVLHVGVATLIWWAVVVQWILAYKAQRELTPHDTTVVVPSPVLPGTRSH
jgi:hypothetical protein